MRPLPGTYPPYFENYINLVQEEKINFALRNNWNDIHKVLSSVQPDKENYAYADGKWTVKQLVNHVLDAERVFAYRALRFARRDPQVPLPFDENLYAQNSFAENRKFMQLINEFEHVRKANSLLFESFSEETLLYCGQTRGGSTSVLAIGYMICGHAQHHLNILKERYL